MSWSLLADFRMIRFLLEAQTVTFVRVEAIITSLVFDHALRIRVKAEPSDENAITVGPSTSEAGMSSDSAVEREEENNTVQTRSSTADTSTSTSTTATIVDSLQARGDSKAGQMSHDEGQLSMRETEHNRSNLVGRINNLVTSDLEHISNGRDFLVLCMC